MRKGQGAIMHKVLVNDLLDKEVFVTQPLILYVSRGVQRITCQDGSHVVVKDGQFVLFPRDIYLVSDFVTENGVFDATLFFMPFETIETFLTGYGLKDIEDLEAVPSGVTILGSNPQIDSYVQSLQSVYFREDTHVDVLNLKILELLYLISNRKDGFNAVASVNRLRMPPGKRDLKQFMETNCFNNLSIDDYAMLSGRSVSTFMRDFKKEFKATPNQWIIDQRLRRARKMLSLASCSVTDVAIEVGYESTSHFISAYKRKFGVTPKKEMRNSTEYLG